MSRTFQGSRREAEEALAELREQAQQGGPLRVDPMFGELTDAYVDWYQREVDADVPGAESVAAAGRTIATEAERAVGAYRVGVLADGSAITGWYQAMIDSERPADQVREVHDQMMRILGWGVAHGWIRRTRDPRTRIVLPALPMGK